MQRGQLLQPGQRRDRARHADGPGGGHRPATARPCLTTRDFGLVDQDQSDNVITLVPDQRATGQTAQNTAANAAAIAGATTLVNGSDDKPARRVPRPGDSAARPFTRHRRRPTRPACLARRRSTSSAPAPTRRGRSPLVPAERPADDPGRRRVQHRQDQRLPARWWTSRCWPVNTNATQVAADYCQNMVNIQTARQQAGHGHGNRAPARPVAAIGNSLANVPRGNRLSVLVRQPRAAPTSAWPTRSPLTLDGNQVATAVTYNTAAQQAAKVTRGDHHGRQRRDRRSRWRHGAPAGQASCRVGADTCITVTRQAM